jgi:hypothetical protein
VPWTGHYLNKFSYGTSLFQLPLFLVAHAWCSLPGSAYAADGYSLPYQLAVALSTPLFTILGLFVLRRLLLRYCDDRATTLALIAIGFGTNLFFYSTVQPGMTHGYVFFLFALISERTDQWHRTPKRGIAAAIGLAIGLAAVTRPVDALVLLVPLLWGVGARASFTQKMQQWRTHRMHFVWAIAAGVIAVMPQLLYWKAVTDHFVFFSYLNERFLFNDPHVVDGLFGYRKGWFVYTPLALLGFIGLALMLARRTERGLAVPVLAYFGIAVYVIFSWQQWWYGGSFGCRPLIPMLALLALPIALLAARMLARGRLTGLLLGLLILAGVRLNLFQQQQYLATIIHWDSMTKERYWEVFGKDSWKDLTPFPPDAQ